MRAQCVPRAVRGADGRAALQGAFAEHQVMFQKVNARRRVVIVLVRTPEDLGRCDALVIPGGGASASFPGALRVRPR